MMKVTTAARSIMQEACTFRCAGESERPGRCVGESGEGWRDGEKLLVTGGGGRNGDNYHHFIST